MFITFFCAKCGEYVDTKNLYGVLCKEVGDRENKTIPEKKVKEWDAIEDKNSIYLCSRCYKILDRAQKEIERNKIIVQEFSELLKKL